MQEKKLDGNTYCRLLRGGYRKLREHAAEINDLNVFPIPDGDTGDNLCATVRGGVQAVWGAEDLPLWEAAERVSRGMLLGARGNSGVILSRMFAGIAEGFKGLKEAGHASSPQPPRRGCAAPTPRCFIPSRGPCSPS